MRSKTKRYVSDIIVFAVLVFLDRITKIWAVDKLKDKDPIELIKGVLELYYLPNGNTGAAFGMLAGHKMLFLLIAIVVVSVIVYLVRVEFYSKQAPALVDNVLRMFMPDENITKLIHKTNELSVI